MSRTALVTGASSGIGLEVARALVSRGYRVLGTTRNPDALQPSSRVPGVEYLALDLTDRASIEACARAAGTVDVLVNNAGESQMGPLEELPLDAIDRLFQVNVLGAIQLTQLLLPGMRERGNGRVVMVGSMLASFPLAFRSSYVATKCALKGFATAARRELSPFGVWLTTVEPGTIATGIGDRRTRYIADGSPYTADYTTVSKAMQRNEDRGIRAETVAELVVKAIEADKPKPLYAVGNKAPLVFTVRRLAPRAFTEKMMARFHGLK
ncbi:SDR family NAD(P)-dependent oxidoreductase [Rhodococcus hoagii]|uniref:Oxidoreductase, short chain dehydrogenase/reductase family protein n=1 Tax=Prescottella equi ATCC 33707 TaxID=525370 RepID=E9T810_RHOHA|nr:SDR family oxidoreductase [Prescottella equi]EGD21414.1 oxidoreductase, short chain dehydrogenase/reductase family protein [Prescottella equi ATCC 33707]MBU4615785.1 SDR family oxidoreductase [Rhodococcus sp. GG48]NKS51888.1 SDR family NAD(P)-dependent oxidoreductase [Prescottella equi]